MCLDGCKGIIKPGVIVYKPDNWKLTGMWFQRKKKKGAQTL